MTLTGLMVFALWATMTLYCLAGGLTFGFTLWSLLTPTKSNPNASIRPRWELAQLALLVFVVLLLIAFPDALTALTTALSWFYWLIISGLVLRVIALLLWLPRFRQQPFSQFLRPLLAGISLIVPVLLGICLGVVVTGQLYVFADAHAVVRFWTPQTTPFALLFGALALTLCASLAAAFLGERAEKRSDETSAALFRRRTLLSVGLTIVLCLICTSLAPAYAPILWHGMLAQALLVVGLTIICCALVLLSLIQNKLSRAFGFLIADMIGLFSAWGLALQPYLVPPSISIDSTVAPDHVLQPLLITIGVGTGLLLLAWSLYHSRLRRRQDD